MYRRVKNSDHKRRNDIVITETENITRKKGYKEKNG